MTAKAHPARNTESLTHHPRKPLYLATTAPIRVSSAGASLVIMREPGPRRQFPLARVERVVCNRNAQWTGDALLLCLEHGVSVTWLDGHGKAIGDATPVRIGPLAFADQIDAYLELQQWPACYANWLRRRRLSILRRWSAKQRMSGRSSGAGHFEALKRAYVYRSEPPAFAAECAAWCHALTISQLMREGLCKRYWGHGGQALELCADLSDLVCAEMALDCGSLPIAASDPETRLLFFEGWSISARQTLFEHLGDFRRHVARETN